MGGERGVWNFISYVGQGGESAFPLLQWRSNKVYIYVCVCVSLWNGHLHWWYDRPNTLLIDGSTFVTFDMLLLFRPFSVTDNIKIYFSNDGLREM